MSELAVGAGVWIPCRVKPGPFTNERVVIVDAANNNWIGFVNISWLQTGVERGDDQVLAKVTEVRKSEGVFLASIPGNAPSPSEFTGPINNLAPYDDSVEARPHQRA